MHDPVERDIREHAPDAACQEDDAEHHVEREIENALQDQAPRRRWAQAPCRRRRLPTNHAPAKPSRYMMPYQCTVSGPSENASRNLRCGTIKACEAVGVPDFVPMAAVVLEAGMRRSRARHAVPRREAEDWRKLAGQTTTSLLPGADQCLPYWSQTRFGRRCVSASGFFVGDASAARSRRPAHAACAFPPCPVGHGGFQQSRSP